MFSNQLIHLIGDENELLCVRERDGLNSTVVPFCQYDFPEERSAFTAS